jgi:hypothetical protein
MKRIIVLSILLGPLLPSLAQSVEKEVNLQEVEVKAARVVDKADGLLIFPSEEQKAHSSSGYSILQKLSLPNIRIDEISHSISSIDNRGSVQLRINGIVVDKAEMLSLDPKDISKIDFINNPGVRYGEGIAYVINIIVRKANSGYIIGTDISQSFTAKNGDDMIYSKWNTGKSEVSLSYDFGYNDYKGNRMKESADYHLNDGSVYTIQRNDFASRSRSFNNNVKLTYNLTDSTNYVFQATLSGDFMNIPGDYNCKNILDGTNRYIATDNQHSLSSTPVVDLYYSHQLTPKQSITLNTVGTYINTDAFNYYDEGVPYQYNVDGKTYSLITEAIYENKLKPFILSAGVNNKYKYTRNEYTGDAKSLNTMQNNDFYAFSDIKGNLNKLRYTVGMGVSYLNYHQQEHEYNYWLFRAKTMLAYNITNEIQLSYSSQMYDAVSRIAMISDAIIRTNSMEWTVGCPDLKPNRDIEHTLKMSYDKGRWQSFIQCYYKSCNRPNMAVYERTADNRFIYTQRNQKEIDVLHVMAYANYWLIPKKLTIATYGGLFRCFNFGDDYTHCYTSYFNTESINAYLGHFTLVAYADNGSRFLEGETKCYNASTISLQGAYQYKNWQFSLTWSQPFSRNYKMYESEVLNRNLHKIMALYSSDNCNLISLNVTWRLNRGRKYQGVDKTINLKDSETGIIK